MTFKPMQMVREWIVAATYESVCPLIRKGLPVWNMAIIMAKKTIPETIKHAQ
jgi:hypothetical protein